ncbi:hypothetical protein CRI94_02485 [Longibacter salinarum]|uniref:Uncharacterized protein n=1 Tax=Longibacter salinarum TaxID=1850348 RepID=A0A2A8D2R4_9BACT|nr:hypothetical protein [Longibacter salinarum]PEN15170.1 hypothetical protein CRI94_02485 [Longibacter salinarum]
MSEHSAKHADEHQTEHSGEAETPTSVESQSSNDAPEDVRARDMEYEELVEELERLRAEVTRLRARQAAAEKGSWLQQHPVAAIIATTTLGAAAGYVGAQYGRPKDTFSERTRKQLRKLAEQARDVASEVQVEIGNQARTLRDRSNKMVEESLPAAKKRASLGNGAVASPSIDGEKYKSAASDMLEQVMTKAQEAGEAMRERAQSATHTSAADAVRSYSSDDGIVPADVKAKAAGLAATSVGLVLMRKLARSAGKIGSSMLIAYITKKVVDSVRKR